MLDLKQLHLPKSPEEAVRALAESEGKGLYVGGGTVVVRAASPRLDFLVDLSAAGMSYVRSESRDLLIGATTTVAVLARSFEAYGVATGLLHEAAMSVATHTIRNLATVGGNLITWSFPADLPVAFLVLDARIVGLGGSGRKEMPVSDLFARRQDVWEKGDLLVEIRVPIPPHELSAGFEKIGRKAVDVAMANAAATLLDEGGKIGEARVAVGAMGVPPRRFEDCESFLKGKAPAEEVFAEAGKLVASSVEPRSDHRASADYRRRAAAVAVERALMKAAGLLPRHSGGEATTR